jgi:hypothetical protein
VAVVVVVDMVVVDISAEAAISAAADFAAVLVAATSAVFAAVSSVVRVMAASVAADFTQLQTDSAVGSSPVEVLVGQVTWLPSTTAAQQHLVRGRADSQRQALARLAAGPRQSLAREIALAHWRGKTCEP